MNNQQKQLDEIAPALAAAGRALGGWALKGAKWAIGGSKTAKVARGVATAAGLAKMAAGGKGGQGEGEPGPEPKEDEPKPYQSIKVQSSIDPTVVGHDAQLDQNPNKIPGPPERPNPIGRYGEMEREKKRMRLMAKGMSESWAAKLAGVASRVGGAAKTAGKVGMGAATGRYGRGVQAATIGGAVAGAGALLARKARGQKAASKAMYGGGANPNPYARRTIGSRLGFGTASESVDEGIIGTALKGAAIGAAGYGAYKGVQALRRSPEARARLGRVAGGVMRGVGSLAKHWNKMKSGGNTQSSGSESPMRKKVVNTAGRVGSALANR